MKAFGAVLWVVVAVGVAVGVVACDAAAPKRTAVMSEAAPPAGELRRSAEPDAAADSGATATTTTGVPTAGEAQRDPTKMIVYTAEISLVVDDFDAVRKRIDETLPQVGAYVGSAEVSRWDGRRRKGRWVLRVPADKYGALLEALAGLGHVESSSARASDVTAEFVDVEAQANAKRNVEKRLVALLATQTGKITDVLEVERELGRVREEIDRMEGRMRYLRNQAAYSTVTLDVLERPGYEPPPSEPTLAQRVEWAWKGSVRGVVGFAKGLVVFVVAVVPWVPFLAVGAGILVGIGRLWGRRRRRRAG